MRSAFRVGIIGLGPKGLFALERLITRIREIALERKVELHLFERSGKFGSGMVYDPAQPDYLLMNYPNRNINIRPNAAPAPPLSSLTEWLQGANDQVGLGDSFASRKQVGEYFAHCFDRLLKSCPEGVSLHRHHAEVCDITKNEASYTLAYKAVGQSNLAHTEVEKILVTTGHCSWKGKLKEQKSDTDIPFVYPVEQQLRPITAKQKVAIKGMGLTFIDTVLALTEGRGGRFERNRTGTLLYLPSNEEPEKIYAYSRSGLPMVPRSGLEGKETYSPQFFTYDAIFESVGINERPGFTEHILPLFIRETSYRYYSTLFKKVGLALPIGKGDPELEEQINTFHTEHPQFPRFDFENLFRPVSFENPDVELGPLAYHRYLVQEAKKTSKNSAFMAAAVTWGKLSETFNSVYNFGGMSAEAHRQFDREYRSKLNRISYGPPISNMEKIIALLEIGVLNLEYAQSPQLRKVRHGWELFTANGRLAAIDAVIDARIPTNASLEHWSPLLQNLRARGLVREFIVPGKASYHTASPEINRGGNIVCADGRIDPNITFYGTPTEGLTYDNDTLSSTRNDFASEWAVQCITDFSTPKTHYDKRHTSKSVQ